MSALPFKADMLSVETNVRYVPKADSNDPRADRALSQGCAESQAEHPKTVL
jgi:hypothetical protein